MTDAATATRLSPDAAPWYRGRMGCFDVETSAPPDSPDDAPVNPLTERIVQAAFCLVGGGQDAVKHTWLVDPGHEVHPKSTKIHGVSTADVKAKGVQTPAFLEQLEAVLRPTWDAGIPVAICNAPFDCTVLASEWRRLGIVGYEFGFILDPLVLDKHFDRYRKGSRKLVALCDRWGAKHEGAHDATHDAIAAARVVYAIAKAERAVGDNTLGNLQALQAEWYREQAQGLDAYFRKQGKPGVDSFAWPARPLAERLVP